MAYLKSALLSLALFGVLYMAQAAPTNRDAATTELATTTELAVPETTAIDTLSEGDGTGIRVKRNGCCGCGCCCCRPCCCCCRPCCCCRCCRCCTCCTTCCRCCRCCCCKPCCCGCCGCGCCGCGGGRKRRALQNLKIRLADKIEKETREGVPAITAEEKPTVTEEEQKEISEANKPDADIQLPEPVYNLEKEVEKAEQQQQKWALN